MHFTPQISYRYSLEEVTHIGQRMAEFESLDEMTAQDILGDDLVSNFVADFYRRHRRACITVARFAGVPVAHGLYISSLPF